MGKSSPAPPPAPDPVATANAQGAANVETARAQAELNRVNQNGPFGSLTYSTDPRSDGWLDQQVAAERAAYKPAAGGDGLTADTGFDEASARQRLNANNPYANSWTATTTLSPAEQRKYDMSNEATDIYGQAAISQLKQAQAALSQRFDPSIPDRTGQIQTSLDFTGIGDPNQSRNDVANALYARLNPGLQQARSGLENQLRNQGLVPGSEAWNNSIRDATQRETDARLGVEAQAGAEQSRIFDLALQKGQFNNQGVGQQSNMDQSRLQQLLAVRNQPINEAAALLNGSQINLPQFQNVPQTSVGQTDVLGAYGQSQAGQQNAYNANMQTANANRTGMYSTAAAAVTAAAAIA